MFHPMCAKYDPETTRYATTPLTTPNALTSTTDERSPKIRLQDVLILGGLSAIGPLSTDMYLPALPSLSHDLGSSMAQTQITLSAGILGLALGQLFAGPLSDALGRRRPLLVGMAMFTIVSFLCVFAPSIAVLMLLRFVQGVAGASGIVIALTMTSDLYTGDALARSLALLMMVSGLAPITAPVLGSLLLTFTSWRGVFVTLTLIGIVFLVTVTLWLRETLEPARRQSGSITETMTAVRALLANRRFIGYALSAGAAFASGITYISASPFIFQNVYGISPQWVGFAFAVNALGIVIMAQVSARLIGRIPSRTLLIWGAAASALGGISLLVVVIAGIGLAGVLLSLFVVIASLGLIAPNAASLALARTQTAGSASALLGVLQLLIGSVAAPLVGLGGGMTALPMAGAIAIFGAACFLIVVCI
jgi:MFS transporter, DHA1 family, multidrug resistance protein